MKAAPTLSVVAIPEGLAPSYQELILISDESHLSDLDTGATDTLLWSTDWLAWRQWCDRGGHGVHFEHFLRDWSPPAGNSHMLSGGEWMYADGVDMTLFEGVSLGKLFNWEVGGVYHAFHRARFSLMAACRAFGVRRLRVRGIRAEYHFLDDGLCRLLIDDVAAQLGLEVAWEIRAPLPDPLCPEMPFHRESPPEPKAREWARGLYEYVIDTLFAVADRLRPHRPRFLLFNNPLVVKALLQEAAGRSVQPVLLAGTQPKSLAFLRRCLADGVRLARLPRARLTARQRADVAAIRVRIEEWWAANPPPDAYQQAIRQFVRRTVLAGPLFEGRATEAVRFSKLFRRLKLDRVQVGDSENQTCRTILELAERDGIGRDELLNGMFLSAQKVDSRTGDNYRPALIQRLLAWGAGNEAWLSLIGSSATVEQTGYPIVDPMRALAVPPAPRRGRALVLPLHVDRTDVTGLYGEVYAYLVETVRGLHAIGYDDVRVKVHPGFHDIRYYQAVLTRHAAECQVYKDGPLADHIAWADIVVGPVNSGAFIETMAMRRPYFPMRNLPSSLEPALFAPAPVSDTVAQVLEAITAGRAGDDVTLTALAGWDPETSAADRVWRAIERACR
ncbi:MAG: hypothetical protein HQL42_02610 [Alphaproteobacteria bacterium]|nr:hypothetical protein [Alphaproteobacteria bacterium]